MRFLLPSQGHQQRLLAGILLLILLAVATATAAVTLLALAHAGEVDPCPHTTFQDGIFYCERKETA